MSTGTLIFKVRVLPKFVEKKKNFLYPITKCIFLLILKVGVPVLMGSIIEVMHGILLHLFMIWFTGMLFHLDMQSELQDYL